MKVRLLLGAILTLAAGLRLWGVDYGLPYAYHPDEPFMIGVAWRMFRSGDLDPNFWDYPSMQMYLLLVFIALRELLSPHLPFLALPGMEYLMGRLLNVAYAVGTVYLVYRSGSRLFGTAAALVGAALLAVAQQHNLMSHFLKVDIPTTFWAAATLAASLEFLGRPTLARYALAGAMVGLTAAGKYPAATVAIVVILSHALVWRARGVHEIHRLVVAGFSAIVAFVLACPYTVINFSGFMAAFRGDIVGWAATGHDGWDGDVLVTYLRWLFLGRDAALSWVALAAMITVIPRRSGNLDRRDMGSGPSDLTPDTASTTTPALATLLVASFPLLFLAELSLLWVVRFPWYVLPMYPFLAILAGAGAITIYHRISQKRRLAWAAIVLVGASYQLTAAADESSLLASEDVRTTALRWIESTLPPGSRIVREGYTPEINGERFRVTILWRAIDQEPTWYRAESVDFLVLGNFLHGRYFDAPDRYPAQVAQYRALMDGGERIARFEGPLLATRAGIVDVYKLR